VKELDLEPAWTSLRLFEQIEQKLKYNPKVIVVDEIDYLFSNKHTIETLRDIHDKLGVPILLVGMELADKKLLKYGHINDRIFSKMKFEKLGKDDFREIIETLSEVKFSNEAIRLMTNRNLQFRQIVKVIAKAEQLATTNKLLEISEDIAKGIIDEE
jgi:DNA transposition AAA+ family ATPase